MSIGLNEEIGHRLRGGVARSEDTRNGDVMREEAAGTSSVNPVIVILPDADGMVISIEEVVKSVECAIYYDRAEQVCPKRRRTVQQPRRLRARRAKGCRKGVESAEAAGAVSGLDLEAAGCLGQGTRGAICRQQDVQVAVAVEIAYLYHAPKARGAGCCGSWNRSIWRSKVGETSSAKAAKQLALRG